MNRKPILLVVMDGVGISLSHLGDAVSKANTPTLDYLMNNYTFTKLKAHGKAVGLPSDDDMGNSEVGHNALGCGQIYSQGAKLVDDAINSKEIYNSSTWKKIVSNVNDNNSTLHFLGLLSDGNVHSNIKHLLEMIKQSKVEGIKRVRVHVLLDGRDVEIQSAIKYIDILEDLFKELNDTTFDARIASGGGRMKITMDRYNANWEMVKKGWLTHVEGVGNKFNSAKEAILAYRSVNPSIIDQDLDSFVICENDKPIGKIKDNDSVIMFNFRGDRAIEISLAFDDKNFNEFSKNENPKVVYAGMLEYDGDLKVPSNYLVNPPLIKDTLTQVLVKHNINEFAISETQKFGHVTYFWNGNNSGKINEELETYVEIASDKIDFSLKPWMKSCEITDTLIEALKSHKYEFLRVNYPNGDMVGHTGNLDATICSMEALDLSLTRLYKVCKDEGYIMIVTADHGNAEEMIKKNKKGVEEACTTHTLNKVPFIIVDDKMYNVKDKEFGLSNVAPTILKLFDIDKPSSWDESIIE